MARFVENAALSVATILYVGTLFSLSLLTESSIFIVFAATLPILLYIIALFYLTKLDVDAILLWFLPIVFPALFLILWYTGTFQLLSQTDGPVVAVLNILISYVINIFVLLIIGIEKIPGRRVVHEVHHHHELKSEIESVKEELQSTRKSLEDAHTKRDGY